MSSVSVGRADVNEALTAANALVDMGVPVFVARLDRAGNPMPPPNWEKTRPDHVIVGRWRPGMALCAVTGVVFDVIDIDPRNGGKASFERMSDALGDDGPEVYWRVKTPSGGLHLWIATLGIRKCKPLPGIDLQAGNADGEGRGFVFLPPTVRPSKATGEPVAYAPTNGTPRPADAGPCEALVRYVERCMADRPEAGGGLLPGHRQKPDVYRAACLGAPAGGQRDALMKYVHELERRGYDEDDIIALCLELTLEMPTYDTSSPWQRKHIVHLLHPRGKVIPDATPEEMLAGEPIRPISAGLIKWASEIEEVTLEWLWMGYLAFRELTLLDGEKGMGKSSICDDIIARATRGRAMPGCEEAMCGPVRVMVFTDEGHSSVLKKRLKAAGADLSMVAFSNDRPPKRVKGKAGSASVVEEWELALPDGAKAIADRIRAADARLVIFDPITDYLTSKISTNNDASVRQALRPLAVELGKAGAAGLALRHMNKNRAMEAKFRGGGTTAFQNRSRVHLVVGEVPPSSGIVGKYGLAMVDSNLTVKRSGVLTYSIVDSDVELDDQGNMVGHCVWHDYEELGSDVLTNGPSEGKRGPAATAQPIIREILEELFREKDTWQAGDIRKELSAAGYKDHHTYDKVVVAMGVRRFRVARRGGGVRHFWTIRKEKVSEAGEGVRPSGRRPSDSE